MGEREERENVKQFFQEFENESSPGSDDGIHVRSGIVGNYRLTVEDVEGEVFDWSFHYLEQKKCPHELAVVLASTVSREVSSEAQRSIALANEQGLDEEDTSLLDAVQLYSQVISFLHELSLYWKDHLREETMNTDWPRPPLYSVSFCAIKNGRRRMEDRHVILHDLNVVCGLKEGPQHSYYAVFDGHAGIEAASYGAAHLHLNLVHHPDFYTDTEKAIKEAFRITDQQFLERSGKEGIKSGCTVVCCLIRERTLYLAWLGDSQAILVRQGEPLGIVSPHKPDREDERTRIENDGGCVLYVGTWRVSGTLAVSRALGDFEHKPYISCEPDIKTLSLEGTEDFLVLACDGLWDKLSLYDVAALVYSYVKENPDKADTVASQLVHQAKEKGSNDNITVVVTFLREPHNLAAPTFPSEVFSQSSFLKTCNGKVNHEELSYSVDIHEKRSYEHKPMHFINGTNGFEKNDTFPDLQDASSTCDSDLTMEVGVDVPLSEQAEQHKSSSWNENIKLPDKEDVALVVDDAFEKHEYEPAENLKSKDATLLPYQFSHQATLDFVPCTVVTGRESASVKIDEILSSDLTSNNELDLSIDSFTGQANSEGNLSNSCKKAKLAESSLYSFSSGVSEVENDRNRKTQTVQALKNVRNFDVESKGDDFSVEHMSHRTSLFNDNVGEFKKVLNNVEEDEAKKFSVSNLAGEILNEFKVVQISAQEIQASSTDFVNCLKDGDQQVLCADHELIVNNLCSDVSDASQKTVLLNTIKTDSNETSVFVSCETTKCKEPSENENILEFQSSMVTSEQEKLLEKFTGMSGISKDEISHTEQKIVGTYSLLTESEMLDKRKESMDVFSLSIDTHQNLDMLEDTAGHLGLNTETYEQLDKTKDSVNEPISSAQEVEKPDEPKVLNNFILTTEIDKKLTEPEISTDVSSVFAETVQKQEASVDEYCLTTSIDENLGKPQESVGESNLITEAMENKNVSEKLVNEAFATAETPDKLNALKQSNNELVEKLDRPKEIVNNPSSSIETVDKLDRCNQSIYNSNLLTNTVENVYELKQSVEEPNLMMETEKSLDEPKRVFNEAFITTENNEKLGKPKKYVDDSNLSTEIVDGLEELNESDSEPSFTTETMNTLDEPKEPTNENVEKVDTPKESDKKHSLTAETMDMVGKPEEVTNKTIITTQTDDEKLDKPKELVEEPYLITERINMLDEPEESTNEIVVTTHTVENVDTSKVLTEEPSLTTETMNMLNEPEESRNETVITKQTVEKLDKPKELTEEPHLTTETINMLDETVITTHTVEKVDTSKELTEEPSLTTKTMNVLGEPEESTNETVITTHTVEKVDASMKLTEEPSLTTKTMNVLGEPEESTNETVITTHTVEKEDASMELTEESSLTTKTMNVLGEPEESTNETVTTTQTVEKLDKPKESVEEPHLTKEIINMLGKPEESTNETVVTTHTVENVDTSKVLTEEPSLTTETMNMLNEPEESTNETVITMQTVEKLDEPKELTEEPHLTTETINMLDETVITTHIVEKVDTSKKLTEEPHLTTETMNMLGKPEESTNETVITTHTVEKVDASMELTEEPSLTTKTMNVLGEPEESTNETVTFTQTVEKLDKSEESIEEPHLTTEIMNMLGKPEDSTNETVVTTHTVEKVDTSKVLTEEPSLTTETMNMLNEPKESTNETVITMQTVEKLDKPKESVEEPHLTIETINMLDETVNTTHTVEKVDTSKELTEEPHLNTETINMLGEPEESTNETVVATHTVGKVDTLMELTEEPTLTTEIMSMLGKPEESTNETGITTQTVEKLDKPKESVEEPHLTTEIMNMLDEPEDATNETVITTQTVEKEDTPKELIEEPSLTTATMNVLDEPEYSSNETVIASEKTEKLFDSEDLGSEPSLSTEIAKNLEEPKELTENPSLSSEAPKLPNMLNEFAEIPVKVTESNETCIYTKDKETVVEGTQENCEPCAETFLLQNIVKSDNKISDINNQALEKTASLGKALPSTEDSGFEKDSEWKYIQGDDKPNTQAIKHTKVSITGSPSKTSSIKSETSRNIKLSSSSKTKQNLHEDKKERKPVAGKAIRNQHEKKEISSKVTKTVSKQTKSTLEMSSLKQSPVTSSANLKTGKPNNVTVRPTSKQVSTEAKTESTAKVTTTSCTSLNKLSRPSAAKNTHASQSTRTISSSKVSSGSSSLTQNLKSTRVIHSSTAPKSGKVVSSQEVGNSSVKPEKSSSPPQVKVSCSSSSVKKSTKKDSSGVVGKKNETTLQNKSSKPASGTAKNLKTASSDTKALEKQKTEPSSSTTKNLKPSLSSTKSVNKQKPEPSSSTRKNLKLTSNPVKSVDKLITEPTKKKKAASELTACSQKSKPEDHFAVLKKSSGSPASTKKHQNQQTPRIASNAHKIKNSFNKDCEGIRSPTLNTKQNVNTMKKNIPIEETKLLTPANKNSIPDEYKAVVEAQSADDSMQKPSSAHYCISFTTDYSTTQPRACENITTADIQGISLDDSVSSADSVPMGQSLSGVTSQKNGQPDIEVGIEPESLELEHHVMYVDEEKEQLLKSLADEGTQKS